MRGDWSEVATTIERPWSQQGRFVTVPMIGRNDCWAHALYQRESPHMPIWRLVQIIETVPPMSPQEKARQYTDDRTLPPLTPDGRIDYEAIAAQREREWQEHEATR
jgi:hypothetical protein